MTRSRRAAVSTAGRFDPESHSWAGYFPDFPGITSVLALPVVEYEAVVPMRWRYRQAVGRTGEARLGRLTALVGVG